MPYINSFLTLLVDVPINFRIRVTEVLRLEGTSGDVLV